MICVSIGERWKTAVTLQTRYGMLPVSIMMNIEKAADVSGVTEKDLTLADKWILSKVNALTKGCYRESG